MKIRAAILLFSLLICLDLTLAEWTADWRLVPAILAGWFMADLASGLVHMLMDYIPCPPGKGLDRLFHYQGPRDSAEYDTLRHETLAQVGPVDRLLFDFKVHHPRPWALGRRSLYHQVWSTILFMSLPLTVLLTAVALVWTVPGYVMAAVLVFLLGGTFSQYFHGTLHRRENPAWVHALRRVGVLMTPAMHDVHHRSLQRDFSTLSGWSNPLLNIVFRTLRAHGKLPDHGLEPN